MPIQGGRNPDVADIVRYFDQPERCAWHLLTDKEAAILHAEIKKFHEDFAYAAQNYYWLTTKDGTDTLLKFMDTQEMLYETIQHLRQTPKGRERGVRILIIKARQLYISSFVEAYLAWLTQTNVNHRGLVVSYDEGHAGNLFQIILHIYEMLPWWLQPMIRSKLYLEGLHLANPDPDLTKLEPGLNSRIIVQGANQNVGVAEGVTVNGAHLSEFGSWVPNKARKIIMGDFRWALPDAPNTFAILETRVRQASKFAERLWESQVELGEDADWYPFFIPIYFDRSHFVPPRAGWKPEEPEIAIRDRAAEEWCQCSGCRQIRPAAFGGGESMIGVSCKDCGGGVYAPYKLQDGQMRWLEQRRKNAEKMGEAAVAEMQQSLATNPQEAFASVTETVFSKEARDWVSATTRGECLAKGYMAADGVFHAPRRQYGQESSQCWAHGCRQDHSGESNRYLKIWQPPLRGAKYAVSVDPSGGYGGSNDYAVIIVMKINPPPAPDIQVAGYRCNTISAWHLGDLANAIGRWYNNALMIVDYTNWQPTGDKLLNDLKYPNIYRWYQPDAYQQNSNRWHWVWNNKNKESGWAVLDGYLRDHSLIMKDPMFAKELRNYQRLADGSLGAPDAKDDDGFGSDFEKLHDDYVTACVQLVIGARQRDPRRPESPYDMVPQASGLRGPGEWVGKCAKCGKMFNVQRPCELDKCPFCRSFLLSYRCSKETDPPLGFKFDEMGSVSAGTGSRQGAPDELSFGFSSAGDGMNG